MGASKHTSPSLPARHRQQDAIVLNTHDFGSLYTAFDPAEAKRIMDRLELVFTPKRGSWLNIAESELSVLTRQCLLVRFDLQVRCGLVQKSVFPRVSTWAQVAANPVAPPS
jgi:hypothetical protein